MSASASPDLALEVSALTKSFGGTRALRGATLSVRVGTVHALLGGNGSGKSTAIKLLAGVYDADAGDLRVFGVHHPLDSWSASAAANAGLRFVHQDLGLFEQLSIAENFAIDAGYPRNALGGIDWRMLRRDVSRVLAEYELDVDPTMPVGRLRPSDRAMVAIARALQGSEAGRLVLVLDEPTATLAAHESRILLDRVRRLADRGQTVVIVSHRLQEVLSIADDFTVFRDGRVAGALVDSQPSEEELIGIMAGGSTVALRPTGETSHSTGAVTLEVRGLVSGPLRGVDLAVHRGEIVGIAGLVGSGRSSLLKVLFGAVSPQAGVMAIDGEAYCPRHVPDAMEAGVALVPENRVREAAFMDRSVRENLAVAMLTEYFRGRWMPRRRERVAAASLIRSFGVKVAGPDSLFSSMSGGNQQKVVLARWLQRTPRLLLLDEPTQGVDVMSRADIYTTIRAAAGEGCAVVVASSDMTELHALCDRIAFLARGRIVDEVAAADTDIDELTALLLRTDGAASAASSLSRPEETSS
ncbi:sugar ABC transporter ATP-binding protein [Microbacterium hominis]|uniref:Sugar ABC transporter ATP-binding protein n=1 Tax=Microbacterium hominis TaxID=162426 RepID=A0A7D4UCC6_9MICO|nr:sugar ABC transporter ATP-binding protein [Microbacterium hominis]QKJ20543.1 sugar ABC transporter ATP-binding protein [Microbacterium hominis]